jgi:prohibitin 1
MLTAGKLKTINFRLLGKVTSSTIALATLAIAVKSIVIISAGHVGVVDIFGKVSNNTLKPGVNFINPLSSVEIFSTRTKEMKQNLDSPSKEGLILNIEVSVLYHVDPQKAQQLYQTVGGNYEEVLIVPLMRSIVRQVTASHDAQSLYTSKRQEISDEIYQQLTQQLSARGIVIESTPLRKLDLPESLRQAVETKLKTEQESQAMKYTLEKERQEAERKRIAAQGDADAKKIISVSLDDKTLRLRQIEASEKLAQSPNAKVVIMSDGNKNSPLFIQP